uniref:Uncharacterized protein n=1 Tax=Clastoptera arizonana TaxID=38151 RepID=A0A1B6D626_9HEMI
MENLSSGLGNRVVCNSETDDREKMTIAQLYPGKDLLYIVNKVLEMYPESSSLCFHPIELEILSDNFKTVLLKTLMKIEVKPEYDLDIHIGMKFCLHGLKCGFEINLCMCCKKDPSTFENFRKMCNSDISDCDLMMTEITEISEKIVKQAMEMDHMTKSLNSEINPKQPSEKHQTKSFSAEPNDLLKNLKLDESTYQYKEFSPFEGVEITESTIWTDSISVLDDLDSSQRDRDDTHLKESKDKKKRKRRIKSVAQLYPKQDLIYIFKKVSKMNSDLSQLSKRLETLPETFKNEIFQYLLEIKAESKSTAIFYMKGFLRGLQFLSKANQRSLNERTTGLLKIASTLENLAKQISVMYSAYKHYNLFLTNLKKLSCKIKNSPSDNTRFRLITELKEFISNWKMLMELKSANISSMEREVSHVQSSQISQEKSVTIEPEDLLVTLKLSKSTCVNRPSTSSKVLKIPDSRSEKIPGDRDDSKSKELGNKGRRRTTVAQLYSNKNLTYIIKEVVKMNPEFNENYVLQLFGMFACRNEIIKHLLEKRVESKGEAVCYIANFLRGLLLSYYYFKIDVKQNNLSAQLSLLRAAASSMDNSVETISECYFDFKRLKSKLNFTEMKEQYDVIMQNLFSWLSTLSESSSESVTPPMQTPSTEIHQMENISMEIDGLLVNVKLTGSTLKLEYATSGSVVTGKHRRFERLLDQISCSNVAPLQVERCWEYLSEHHATQEDDSTMVSHFLSILHPQ